MKAKIIELLNKHDKPMDDPFYSGIHPNSFETLADDLIKLFSEDKPPEYEYYMHRKGIFYFRNNEVKLKKVPDMSDEMQFNFYNAVQSRGYGVKYKFVNY